MPEDLHASAENLSGAAATQRARALPTPRIAVLPFSNVSADPEQDYFCEGLAAEILIGLARIPGLHLAARSSVFALKREQLDLREVGRRLKVTTVLEGAVLLSEDRLRITVTLVDAATGKGLWSGRFDRALEEVFSVLDEITAGVAGAFEVETVSDHVRKIQSIHTSDVEAYDFYLRGRRLYYQYSRQGVEAALQMFRKAIDIDERYALAYCGIADCYSYLYTYLASSDENMEEADAASRRALELDPLLAEAHASRGVAQSLKCCFEEAEAAFEQAIELDPQLFEARYFYARACFAQGKLEQAARLFDEAHRVRPEDYQSLLITGQIYDALQLPERAAEVRRRGVAIAEQHLKLDPDDTRALYMVANGLVALGETEQGLEWLQRALSLDPDDAMLLYNAGCTYALAHQSDEALMYLEGSVAAGVTQKEWYENDSNLDSVRAHPRFKALLDTMP
ncbi:MAG: tetratricopeptide repeat protein [Rhodothermales bacterium]